MSFGSPQGPTDQQYVLSFRSVQLVEGNPVVFRVTATTEAIGDPAVADVVQAFTDAVHANPDFNLMSGQRMTAYTETITPTVGA